VARVLVGSARGFAGTPDSPRVSAEEDSEDG